MPKDEFELLLERCNERLEGISLNVPALDGGAARRPKSAYTLTPAAPATPPAPPPQKAPPPQAERAPEPTGVREIAPPPARAPEPVSATKPSAATPADAEHDEEEIFPPLRIRPRTPAPVISLPRTTPMPALAPAPAGAGSPSWGRRGAGLAAAAVAAGAFGVWAARRSAVEIDFPAGDADAMAVRADKGDILVAQGKELADFSRDGKDLGRTPLDAPVDALSWDQGSLWSSDGRASQVVERAENGRSTVFALNHVPGDVYVKDKYLWTSEKGGGVLHQFLISRSILGAILQPLDSFELKGLAPECFTIDDSGTLWVADELTRRLYRLRLEDGTFKAIESAPLSPFLGPAGRLRDLTVEDHAIWILTQPAGGRRANLRRIQISSLDWTPA